MHIRYHTPCCPVLPRGRFTDCFEAVKLVWQGKSTSSDSVQAVAVKLCRRLWKRSGILGAKHPCSCPRFVILHRQMGVCGACDKIQLRPVLCKRWNSLRVHAFLRTNRAASVHAQLRDCPVEESDEVCYSESERREEAKKRLEKRLEKRENT